LSSSIDSSDREAILRIAQKFYEWCISMYNEPVGNDANCWVKERLEYNFSVSARSFDGGGNLETILVAPEYSEGSLDWYSFSVDPNVRLQPPPKLETHLGLDTDGENLSENPDTTQERHLYQQIQLPEIEKGIRTFLPSNVTFKGMPNKCWWDFEDASINIGDINADKRDITKMIVMDFALVSDNDWFIIPLPIRTGSLARINSLVVRDVFGERFLIRSADENVASEREKGWSMFKLSYVPQAGQSAQTGQQQQPYRVSDFLFVPPSLGPSLESPEIEKVNFIRDEMSNMAWAVEQTYEGELGDPISGHESNIIAAAARNTENKGEAEEEKQESNKKAKYVMQTHVPTNWIPFLPVLVPGSSSAVDLLLGQMLEYEPGVDTKPKTRILQQQGDNKSNNEYRIKEEEVPRAGVFVSRRFQRTRWIDGSTYLWIGRRKSAGHGEGSSGLRFDIIEEKR